MALPFPRAPRQSVFLLFMGLSNTRLLYFSYEFSPLSFRGIFGEIYQNISSACTLIDNATWAQTVITPKTCSGLDGSGVLPSAQPSVIEFRDFDVSFPRIGLRKRWDGEIIFFPDSFS